MAGKQLEEPDEETKNDKLVLHVNKPTLSLMEAGRYSRLNRLLRITAWVKWFVADCRVGGTYRGSLTVEELANTELYWVTLSQRDGYAKKMLLANQSEVNERFTIVVLNPFVYCEGRLRVGGRLQSADETSGIKHPILLPYAHPFTEPVV